MAKKPTKMPRPEGMTHGAHPFNNAKNHKCLLEHLKKRLNSGRRFRDQNIDRYKYIDRQVTGWSELSDEEKRIREKRITTGAQVPNKLNIPLTMIHADDMTTYFLSMFAPITGMFTMTGDQKELESGKGLIKLMDQHAVHAGYFRQFNRGLFASTKYNISGFHAFWDAEMGNAVGTASDGTVTKQRRIVWQGNRVEALDMYNTVWDPNVHPIDVYRKGEFAATFKRESRFIIQQRAEAGRYSNIENFLESDYEDKDGRVNEIKSSSAYYISPPAYVGITNTTSGTDSGAEDWGAFFGMDDAMLDDNAVELVHMYAWVKPLDFGLVVRNARNAQEKDTKQLWRFTIANGDDIIETTLMNNIHEHIPMYFSVPIEDEMESSQRSVAETIEPFQTFMTYLFNTHIDATRKSLHGIVAYDPMMIDLGSMPDGETAARIPTTPAARGKDIRSFVAELNTKIDTSNLMGEAAAVKDLAQDLMPTQARPSQIAGIDRAIKSQVATVRQGGGRRVHKLARLIDSQQMRPMRMGMYFNIQQFQKDPIEIGKTTVTPESLREIDLSTMLGQGLKTLDREATAEATQEIIFAIMQNSEAIKEFDVPGLLDALSDYKDIEIDLTQFRRTQPQPGEEGAGNVDDAGGESTPQGAQGPSPTGA